MSEQAEKIVIVTRKTALEGLVERYNTVGAARFALEHAGHDFLTFKREHDAYTDAVARVRRECRAIAPRVHLIERGFLPTYLFGPQDLVVVVGPDGLVVNAAKYLDGQPIVGVNPDPATVDGVLLPYAPPQAGAAVARVLAGREGLRAVTMAEAVLSDGQRLLAFNDLFIGPKSHVSARYVLGYRGQREAQSSSGVIVSTGAGSTGWLSSVFNGAAGVLGLPQGTDRSLPWEAEKLRFAVREPFRSRTSSTEVVYGELAAGEGLELESRMPDAGVIFSDGVEADFLQFTAGVTATIRVAARKARLAVPRAS